MYYISSYLGPLGRYPGLISTSSAKFNKKKKERNSSVSLSGFFSLLLSFTTFSLPHTRLKLQRWNPWVSVCPAILKIFCLDERSRLIILLRIIFLGHIFHFVSSFRSCSTGLRPILVKYHFSTLHYYFINISI